ncbi:MAG: MOSC domain-containing protein, partial [Alphaproteobacteria bacterium]
MNPPEKVFVESIYRYPVKGLSPEPLDAVTLKAGQTLPFDRAYAIENGIRRFDQQNPEHLPKTAFLMLMRDERMALLNARFDPQTHKLVIERDGRPVVEGQLNQAAGRQVIAQFFAAFMEAEARGVPRVVSAPNHSFSDVPDKCISIINLASVREIARVLGRPVDPMRFRGNLYIEGLPAWGEFDWIDSDITIAGVRLSCFRRIQRCAATNVDPQTATRDMQIPRTLSKSFGHLDCGIYARVTQGGTLTTGDLVVVDEPEG